jgi:hypothetical protein
MVIGVYVSVTLVGVIGFAVLFAGVMVAATVPAKASAADAGPHISGKGPVASQANLMDRLNERWDRRQGGGNQ